MGLGRSLVGKKTLNRKGKERWCGFDVDQEGESLQDVLSFEVEASLRLGFPYAQ